MSALRLYLPSLVLCVWALVVVVVGLGRVMSIVALITVSVAMKVQASEVLRRLLKRKDRRENGV